MNFFPLLHKKFSKNMAGLKLPQQQMVLLFQILFEDGMPMKHYCEKMMIPKSSITILAEKLIKENLIERQSDDKDRRIIILKITPKGKRYIDIEREKLKKSVLENIKSLNDDDVEKLNNLFMQIKEILNKIN